MLTAGKLKQNSFLNYYVISDIQYLLSHTHTRYICVCHMYIYVHSYILYIHIYSKCIAASIYV